MTTKLNPYDIPVPSHGKDPREFFETSVVVLRLLVQEDQEILDAALAAGDDDEWIEMNRRCLANRRADLETARRNLAAYIENEEEEAPAAQDPGTEDAQSKLEVARIRKDAVAVQLAEAFAAAGPDAFGDSAARDTCESWVARYRYVRDEYQAAALAVTNPAPDAPGLALAGESGPEIVGIPTPISADLDKDVVSREFLAGAAGVVYRIREIASNAYAQAGVKVGEVSTRDDVVNALIAAQKHVDGAISAELGRVLGKLGI